MNFRLSRHAQEQLVERGISLELLKSVMATPQQIISDARRGVVYQSKFIGRNGKIYLLRVFIDNSGEPVVVKTIYVTAKINKYWRQP